MQVRIGGYAHVKEGQMRASKRMGRREEFTFVQNLEKQSQRKKFHEKARQ